MTVWIKLFEKYTYINCTTWLVAGCYFYLKRWKLLTSILVWLKNIVICSSRYSKLAFRWGKFWESAFQKEKSKSVSLHLEVSLTWNQDGAILEKLSLTLFGFKTKKGALNHSVRCLLLSEDSTVTRLKKWSRFAGERHGFCGLVLDRSTSAP